MEDKGDDARIHFGIIAQDLQDAFEAEGLDAGRYGMFTVILGRMKTVRNKQEWVFATVNYSHS